MGRPRRFPFQRNARARTHAHMHARTRSSHTHAHAVIQSNQFECESPAGVTTTHIRRIFPRRRRRRRAMWKTLIPTRHTHTLAHVYAYTRMCNIACARANVRSTADLVFVRDKFYVRKHQRVNAIFILPHNMLVLVATRASYSSRT